MGPARVISEDLCPFDLPEILTGACINTEIATGMMSTSGPDVTSMRNGFA